MAILKINKTTDPDFEQAWRDLRRLLSLSGELLENTRRLQQVRRIVEQVRLRRDEAVAELTARFDGVTLSPADFRIPDDTLRRAHRNLDPGLLDALRAAIENVRHYQQQFKLQNPPDWTHRGARLGLRYRPLGRVGVCVPGASAPLPSTVIMTVVPAQVAGVAETAVISTPRPDCNNSIHPTILGLCHELKVTDVYRVSGAQAVAALALGTKNIKKVDKIVGPGSWWGQLAKKEVYGLVDIDSFAGPSEVLIIADDSARPDWVAADMLSQAEHAPGSALLLTDSASLARETARCLDEQIGRLGRSAETAECVSQYSRAVVTRHLDEAIDLANEFAAEHLQIECRDSNAVAERIVNAGAVFIGHHTPVATGDYYAGPSHTLPTGGSARYFSPLNVNDFLKQSSIIAYDPDALKQAADHICRLARAEGLDAHARSVEIRLS